jgi:hypothetical protein
MFKIKKIGITFALSLLLALPSYAAEWRLDKDQNGIKIYTRAVAGSKIREFKAEILLNTSLNQVLAVFDDVPKFKTWHHKVDKSMQLQRGSVSDRVHYQNLKMPFPVTDRDFIVQSKVTGSENKIMIRSFATPNFCKQSTLAICESINQSNNIMVLKSRGEHQFVLQKEGGVLLTWQQHTEPAGKIPNWLVNKLLLDVPYNTLNKLRQQVKLNKYEKIRLKCENNNCSLLLNSIIFL